MKLSRRVLLLSLLLAAPVQAQERTRAVKVVRTAGDAIQGDLGDDKFNFGVYRALLIGIADYPDMPQLLTPKRDVERLAKILRSQYGFSEVKVLVNEAATRLAIESAIEGYTGKTLSPQDNLLIYFAGHGEMKGKIGYWIPYDGKPKVSATWLSSGRVEELIEQIDAKHVLVVSDSCFAGAMFRDAGLAPVVGEAPDRYIRKIFRNKSRKLLASGGEHPVADMGREGLSAFAYFFITHLEKNERPYVTALEIYGELFKLVGNATDQEPEYGAIEGTFDERGHFVFARVGQSGEMSLEPTTVDPWFPWSLPSGFKRKKGTKDIFLSPGPDPCEMVAVGARPFEFSFGRSRAKKRIAPFLMDRFEVTVERFKRYGNIQGMPKDMRNWGQDGYRGNRKAVVGMSLEHARAFAKWAGKQLPTEVEWEYAAAWNAARKRHRRYPWGDRFDAVKIVRLDRPPLVDLAHEIHDISPWKVCGMGSGVQEWCEPADPNLRGGPWGVLRGATQVVQGRRDRSRWTTTERLDARVSIRNCALGFRCIIYLVR